MEQPKIFRYDTVDSTNTVCKSLAALRRRPRLRFPPPRRLRRP